MALEPNLLVARDDAQLDAEIHDQARRMWIGVLFALPVFVLSMGGMAGLKLPIPIEWAGRLEAVFSGVVVIYCGRIFWIKAWRSLAKRSFNMFTLIALGVWSAYGFSLITLFWPQFIQSSPGAVTDVHGELPLYFESAAVITVLVQFGQWLEARARRRTGDSIRALMDLSPKMARKHVNGSDEDVPLESVRVADILRVRPGERVPVDGVIVDGVSTIDESMLTGEPMPKKKGKDDAIMGGTYNQHGVFLMRATRVGAETVLSRIIQTVAEAQSSRAPIQSLADRVSGWFVPTVVMVALLTSILWWVWGPEPKWAGSLIHAVSVLIIACPCALGLATPMSITVGVGRGARMGVLVRHAEALEKLSQITHLVIDKTGTLTLGKPEVTDIVTSPQSDQTHLLELAASIERMSEHPLGDALVRASKDGKQWAVSEFHSDTGMGVRGHINGKTVLIGKRAYLESHQVVFEGEWLKQVDVMLGKGRTVVWVSSEKQVLGAIGISDPTRLEAVDLIRKVRAMGIDVSIATGDASTSVERLSRELGVKSFRSGLLPKDKADWIQKMKRRGERVAMAGDGINDAPALATADVGIAMGTGTDVAIQNAGVTLLNGDLSAVIRAIELSRSVMCNIRQNLFFAFFYNSLGIPIAAGLLYPIWGWTLNPMWAGLAMSLSSVTVIANSLRLRWVRSTTMKGL